MSNFSNINWAGGNRTGAIAISNATNNLTFGNSSGITMTATLGDININNSSGATVLSNSADAINLTTSANDINITSGNNFTLITSNATGTPVSGFGFLNVVDVSPVATGVVGAVFGSLTNGVSVVSASQVGVAILDAYATTGGGGIGLTSTSNDINLSAVQSIIHGSLYSELSATSNVYLGTRDNAITIDETTGINSFATNGTNTLGGAGGVIITDGAPFTFGSVLLQSFHNDINIVSYNSNVGGGVNLTAIGTNGNIRLTTNDSNTGVVISNISNGGVGTLTVDAGNHLYWNGTFIA